MHIPVTGLKVHHLQNQEISKDFVVRKTVATTNMSLIYDVNHDFMILWGFPGSSDGKESACKAGDLGLIPGSGRSPGEGNGFPLQYSCLENSINREVWQAIVHGVAKSRT